MTAHYSQKARLERIKQMGIEAEIERKQACDRLRQLGWDVTDPNIPGVLVRVKMPGAYPLDVKTLTQLKRLAS